MFRGYGEILRQVLGKNYALIALGSTADSVDCGKELSAWQGPAVNLCGQTTLRQAASLFKRCVLAVGPDTGLSHIACAVGCPHVVIMGGGDFGRFFPYSPLTSIVCLPLDCYQCQWICRYSEPYCIRQIKPEAVAEAIRQTISTPSTKPRIFFQGQQHGFPSASSPPTWQLPDFLQKHDWDLKMV
jgi:ADP-heptose:LPS heptosyltransferase